jgi:hypothetical protein
VVKTRQHLLLAVEVNLLEQSAIEEGDIADDVVDLVLLADQAFEEQRPDAGEVERALAGGPTGPAACRAAR